MTFESPPPASPGSGDNSAQLADIGFYTGIASVVMSFTVWIPIISFCTCFMAPLSAIAAIVMSFMARNKMEPGATGQTADRVKYALYLGIGSLVVYAGVFCVSFLLGFGMGLLDPSTFEGF